MNPPTLRMDLVSDPAHIAATRKTVEAFVAALGFAPAAVNDVGLCVNEAIANIIRHAYAGVKDQPIELVADITHAANGQADGHGDTLTITLRDWGNRRVPDLNFPSNPDTPLRPGGLGLPCLKMLLDTIHFEPQPDGMRLRMTKVKR